MAWSGLMRWRGTRGTVECITVTTVESLWLPNFFNGSASLLLGFILDLGRPAWAYRFAVPPCEASKLNKRTSGEILVAGDDVTPSFGHLAHCTRHGRRRSVCSVCVEGSGGSTGGDHIEHSSPTDCVASVINYQ